MLKIVICAATRDDAEAIHRNAITVLQKARIRCELAFSSSTELIKKHTKPNSYDVYIFDARSNECLELAEHIRSENLVSSILFLNAKRDGELNNIIKYRPSYIVFSFDEAKALEAGIKRCCSEQSSRRSFFTVKTKESSMRFDYKDILCFESVQRIVCMYSVTKAVEFYAKLGDIETSLPESKFVRCHQSYIVNLDYVQQLDKAARYFRLVSGREIPISKSYYTSSVESFEKYSSSSLSS